MENLIFFILFLLSIININVEGNNNFYYDYMELKNTNSIKGIFVWMIILSHYKSYYKQKKKYLYRIILKCFGQKMVSLFLFYSGFGIFESIKKKGNKYIKTLLNKAKILFIKSQIILLFFLLNNLFLDIKMTLKKYILSIIFKTTIGNSNWFAFTIICFYIYSYISFITFKHNFYILGIIILNIICAFHIYFVYNFYYPNRLYTIDNTFCFIVGFYYSLLKNYLNKIIMKNDITYFLSLSFLILIYYYFYITKKTILIHLFMNLFFSLIIVLISMKIRFNNEFLNLLNSHSFSIYLLQRIVMRFIYYKQYFKNNELIRFFFEFILIILISTIFDKFTTSIDYYFGGKNYQNKAFINNEKQKMILIRK